LLQDTGERIIPEKMKLMNMLLLEHVARYSFAIPYMRGRVLDIACGTGYGSQMLAKIRKNSIQQFVAVDIDRETVEYARKTYYHPLISYRQEDALDPSLPEKLGTFDVIVSFETIEHVLNDILFVKHMDKLLRPGGRLVISTPFGQGRGKPCSAPFHVQQLTSVEFQHLITSFRAMDFYFQSGVTIERGIQNDDNVYEPPRPEARYSLGIAVVTKK
jgi:2-polyprenyl-3-methyl-5-hydroxy-6-metoxy-1,4-benzoquinol methylase